MLERISYKNEEYAIILKNSFSKPGVSFVTPDHYSQQMAYMNHPQGRVIAPHVHNPVSREIQYTNEVLVIKKGKLRVDFYNEDYDYLESRILEQGDVILLIKGGHGFEVIEEIEMIEIKQGPYAGDHDKTKFSAEVNTLHFGPGNLE